MRSSPSLGRLRLGMWVLHGSLGRGRPGKAVAAAIALVVATLALAAASALSPATAQAAPCDPPIANEIVCENSKPGDPASEWEVSGSGSASIQGFSTDISVDQGATVRFKVDTDADDYRLDIYRMGYYAGDGARQVATVEPSAALPQSQPACASDAPTGLVDCGNWDESASWAVPADAVSGIYFARLVREDGPAGASHIVFIVRDDDGGSDLLFQTMDTTWQAYNQYGGNSLYVGSPVGRAYKVSYNRPFTTRGPTPEDWVFNAEYPMVRFLERNGYDVSYFTGVDSDRNGAEILEHEAFLSVGHDEYWSGGQRSNVEAARDAGVDLAFFSGNEVFWKTRWEDSIAGPATDHRTLVSYKETHPTGIDDPTDTWTGTWRDDRPINPEGPNPENALTGTLFRVNSGTSAIEVPAAEGKMRFWRNTDAATLAAGETETLAANTLGYEWDEAPVNAVRPAGLVHLSTATRTGVEVLQDNGSTYAPGTATHHLTQYRAPSGALVFGAGTIQWAWGLDGVHDRGGSTPDPDMQQATVNLLADMGGQPDTLEPGLVAATASTDTAAPSSQVTAPGNAAEVPANQQTVISGIATEAGGGEVGAVEVSIDGGPWRPAEGRGSWTYAWTPNATGQATIRTRAADDSGNLETPGPGITVDVVPASCPCSIWSDSFVPPLDSDPGAVELGVKFRSDVAGEITGLRFYKGPANTGTHIGHLWSAGGALLAQATFSGESASGWQQVDFAAPVAIDADTTYVASYHAPNGNYAATNGYFSGQGADSPPLHALADGVDGANGVYNYGPAGVFPTSTFESSNYWVDVVFDDDTGPDTTPPEITSAAPPAGGTGAATSTNVTATFNEAIDPATINGANFELRDSSDALVPATVTYSGASRTATLDPDGALANSATYTATIKGGTGGVADTAGNERLSDHSWSFTTAAPPPPPPDEGPGGPILVVGNSANPFSRYYAEILRAEGLNEFNVTDLSNVDAATLDAYDVVILGETSLSAGQVQTLSDWVTGGGNLIAMRPDPQLAVLLGLTDLGSDLSEGYIQVDTGSSPGAGIVGETMQFHGTADRYDASGATTVATLYSNATTATSNPAVTLRDVGVNGGQAAAFTYDLARSIVYTRQGNPAWAGQSRDGQAGPIRSDNLFFGAAPGDPQPDWVDRDKISIPQADEQQRLLANLIGELNLDRKPLPRFWYFPRSEEAVVVMTGDDHASGGTAGRFDQYSALSPAGCSVADWECVRGTSYVYPNSPLTDAQAATYNAAGFEVGLHQTTFCADFTPASLDQGYDDQLAEFSSEYPSVPAPSTNRTHCIAWSDWASQPKVELDHGIRLDTNYYYWPPEWVDDTPGLFTGSGMPMRFADLDGSMIDVYQGATQMTDESGQSFPFTANTLLDRALGSEGYYGAFVANMHTDSASSAGSDAIVSSALARGVPVVSSRQMLEWLDGRNGSSFDGIAWNGNQLSFTVEVGAGANGLRAMVPTSSEAGALTGVTRDGNPVATTNQTIKGVEYAFVEALPGDYDATYDVDATGPAISNVAHTAGAQSATITWDTNEPADSRVDYGTSPSALTSSESSAGLGTSHSVELDGLEANTTYYYRVTSADAASNSTTDPAAADPPRSFSTPAAGLTDTTTADFAAGSPGADGYIAETADGEVTLKPAVGEEFSGLGLPSGWSSATWESQGGGPGGSATVSGGSLHTDGAFAGTDATFGPGRSLEFAATFGAAPFQHVGFSDNFNSVWAIFSTNNVTGQLFARTNTGSALVNTPLPGLLIGSEHRYRIEWDAGEVRFYVDGAPVATHSASFGPAMNVAASDFNSGGPEVAVDWLRMSPHPASADFDSRVLDAGEQVTWQALSWVAETPAGTGVALSVRTGNTPTPDGSWSAFAPVASSGGPIGGSSRYLQYRATLTSTDAARTPSLAEVSATYGIGGDTTPPTISQRTPAPGATGVGAGANVEVGFSEPMDPATIDGSSFRLRAEGASSDVPATVSYAANTATLDPDADLDPATTYEVTVAGSVEDAAGNALGDDDTWSFTTGGLSLIDTTSADFGGGATGADTYIAETADGEVTLKPAAGAEFGGASLPGDWISAPWSGGGSATVSGGRLHVDGASAGTAATYAAGRALEFSATFTAAPFQTAGFATDLNAPPWATFSTRGDSLFYARTHNGSTSTDTPLPSSLLGSEHRYRIEWDAGEVRFYVDGGLVATHVLSFGDQMRPLTSDFEPGGGELSLDWLRMSPYPGSGSFDSRVLDGGQSSDWGTLAWDATTPAGTGVALSVRTGDTPTPDGSWSAFAPIANGGDVPGSSRYIQYRAALTSGDPGRTPELAQVSVGFAAGPPDTTPPTISQRTPAPGATGVGAGANVEVGFSEPMDPATIDGSSFRLRAEGASSDVPATVSYAANTATLDPDADLDPATTYEVTVAGSVEDAAGNALGDDDTWSFTTGGPSVGFTDTTFADFSAGDAGADGYVSETDDGEVTLRPAVGAEFAGGPGLPAGWSSSTWESQGGGPGGTATVSAGSLHVNGAFAGTDATFGAGQRLEFDATFAAAPFQHVGFSDNFNSVWAIFSTNTTSGQLFARTNTGSAQINTPLPGSLLGSEHRYRIEWDLSEVRFYVDGGLVATHAATYGTAMNVAASDFNAGGPEVAVDWLRMGPYPAAATFDSRVFDAGPGGADWGALSWDATTPAGTGIALSVRTGETPTPDASWSAFAPVASSGDDVAGNSRYLQYRAELTTADPSTTPVLQQVSVGGTEDIAPVAVDDTATVEEDSDANPIDVLANDTDTDGGTKLIASATQPANGTVAVAPDGLSLSYQPDADYCNEPGAEPTDDFTYTLNGGSEATVAVTVDCADDAPVAVDDTATVGEDSGQSSIDVLANDLNGDAGELTIASATQPANGTVAVAPDGLSLSYQPDADYCNEPGAEPTDDFTYTLNGGSEATVAVTVDCADDAPVAVDDTATVGEDSGQSSIDVLANDLNGDAGELTIASATQPANGTVAVAPDGLSLSYQPDADYCNEPGAEPTDDFTYTLNGGSEATVAVTVDCADDAPVAVDDTATVGEDSGQSSIDVLANDLNGDAGELTIASATQPANGTVAVAPDGLSLSYQPDADYCNEPGAEPTDDFTYTLNGGSEATVAVTVTCVEDAPDAPTITGTSPASPANDNTPEVQGTLGAGSPTDVRIYASADCTGPVAATRPAAEFTGGGIPITVADNTTTPLSAIAVGETDSACSNSIDYVEDSAAPDTLIDSGPTGKTNNPSPSFAFHSPQPVAGFECRLDASVGGTWEPCSSPKDYTNLALGPHKFEVRAIDAAGNADPSPAKRTFNVDTVPPNTLIDSGPTGKTNNPSPSFAFHSPQPVAGFECRLDASAGGTWEPCSSPKSYTGLAQGPHKFEVRAIDAAGNADPSPAKRTFNVDTVPPNTLIDSGPTGTTNNPSPSFAFHSPQPVAGFECRLDASAGGTWEPCSSPKSYTGLALGPHTFEVRAIDAAGNADPSPAARSFRVVP